MVGFTRAEMNSGKLDWRTITPPESLARAEQAIRELREQGACIPFEKEYVLRDGTHLPVLVGAVRYSSEPLEWVCWITDLRAHKERARAEETSRKLQMELEAELRGAGPNIWDQHPTSEQTVNR
jgi:PAS domain-containing protein